MNTEEANIIEEKFTVNLTEWEIDTIRKSIASNTYPGTLVDVAYKLQLKLKEAFEKAK